MSNTAFLGILLVLFALDAASTVRFLKMGVEEANGFVRRLMLRVGVQEALLVVKVAAFAVIAYQVESLTTQWRLAILAMYVGVVLWNVFHILKRRQS